MSIPQEFATLPLYAAASLGRMTVAYALSLAFSLTLGYLAATDRRAERLIVPALDVLQSVPVLGFFPAAVLIFITLLPGSRLGVELAAIFLIFTSMTWNMAFGVYEAITAIPQDLWRVAGIYGMRGWLGAKRLILPACVPRLVYNSMVSWAGGWYFLIACEVITTGKTTYALPGLGRFLVEKSNAGQLREMLLGLLVLVGIIVAMDLLLWRPATILAEGFKYEYTARRRAAAPVPLVGLLPRFPQYRRALEAISARVLSKIDRSIASLERFYTLHKAPFRTLGYGLLAAMALLVAYLSLQVVVYFAALFGGPLPEDARVIPLAILLSVGRLSIAYIIALATALPCAIYLARRERLSAYLTPVIEVLASIPAVALFPFIVVLVIGVTRSMTIPSILLILTGMEWYLLFNLLAGAKSIPEDMEEAARAFGIKGRLYYRRVLLPAMYPSIITGSITAWGGGWNALIVSEYFVYNQVEYHTLGIGYILDKATFVAPDSGMLALGLLGMVGAIIFINKLVWKRLYRMIALYRPEYQ